MTSIRISGLSLSRAESTSLLDFLYTILHKVNYALTISSYTPLLFQTQSSWEVQACRNPDPQAYCITNAKKTIAADIVSMVEEYKKIKWEYVSKWPVSLFSKSVWTILGHSLERGTIYNIRNWCSHRLGIRQTTADEEQNTWNTLVLHYGVLQPLVEELVGKLEAALEDEGAWAPGVNEGHMVGEKPWYAAENEAIELEIGQWRKQLEAKWAEEAEARKARDEGVEEAWEHVEGVVDEGWGTECREGTQDNLSCESSWHDTGVCDDEEEDGEWDTQGSQDDFPWDPACTDDEVHDSGYDEDLPSSVLKVRVECKSSCEVSHHHLWKRRTSTTEKLVSSDANGLWNPLPLTS